MQTTASSTEGTRLSRYAVVRIAGKIAGILLATYGGLLCFGCLCADRIIFQPPGASYKDTDEVLKVPMRDGVRISAVYLPNPNARFTLLCSHGNAEDLGQLRGTLESMRQHGFAVFAYDYRGYGTSGGAPSETSAYHDADDIYQYLVDDLHVPSNHIIVYGRSLGGAMATYTASHHPAAGLILESSFTTAFRVVTRVPVTAFDKFRNIDRIGQVHCPVLIIHGKQDEVVPFSHGQELFKVADEPKLCLWVSGAHHNDLLWVARQEYWDKMEEMVQLIQRQQPSSADH